ncbi:MAG: hypothetical protein AAGL66_16700, partial [Pseudomonadota bacterium]
METLCAAGMQEVDVIERDAAGLWPEDAREALKQRAFARGVGAIDGAATERQSYCIDRPQRRGQKHAVSV